MPQPFIHLHCHTDYSLLDGGCHIPRLIKIAEQHEWPSLAITDHGNLFGAVSFYDAAKKSGIKPIIGCEIYTVNGDHNKHDSDLRYHHLVLLCKDSTGYRNLLNLVSTAYLEGFYYKPRVSKDMLASHAEGLICLSACLRGDLQETILNKGYQEGLKLANEYREIFGKENFFLEIQNHNLDLDKKLIPLQFRLSQETGIPLVATNDAHYLTKDDVQAHDALLCVQTGKSLSDKSRMRFGTPEFYLKTRLEMEQLFDGDKAPLDRTWEIAQMCNLELKKVANPFPQFAVPENSTIDQYFQQVAFEGLQKRMPRLKEMARKGLLKRHLPEYEERLNHEVQVIQKMQYSGYFLIVWDFIRFARSKSIPVGPGRGSAAGSLVAYAMSITDLDPLQYGLLFERFLNSERVSMPDVDIDFCMNRRSEVIQYVTEKYGRDQVSQIITFNSMATKAAIKDVGRVMDMGFDKVNRLTKLVPDVLNISLDEAIKQEPKLQHEMNADKQVNKLIQTARRVEGFARNASVHAAGVVIASEPLKNLVPLFKTNKNEIVTQYDMKSLDKIGLLKMDFLGLTTLTIIDEAYRWIEKRTGKRVEAEDIPLDDKETYALFGKGMTNGIFQFESSGMRALCIRSKPERLEDLCALNALYRPGPIQGGMISDFVDRKNGKKSIEYLLPEIEPLLSETYGVIVYQEQVMQLANLVAGYSLGEADLLRRAMGKKKPAEMAKQRDRFLEGARESRFPAKQASKLFDLMEQFAGYGFNKSHSAAYGYLAYLTAYLKTHYTVEFMAALLSAELNDINRTVRYINECRDMGIEVLAPDITTSYWGFTPAGDKQIRFGLGAIKNLGSTAVDSIIAVRADKKDGFSSLFDFCKTVDCNKLTKRMLECSIKAGALDSLGQHRALLMDQLDAALETGKAQARDRESGQQGLFGDSVPVTETSSSQISVTEWSDKERLAGEKEMLGFYVTGHPLDAYKDKIAELSDCNSSSIAEKHHTSKVAICGILRGIQQRRNREGKPWASAVLEDREGSIELLVFTTNFDELQSDLVEDQPVLVRGSIRADDNSSLKVAVSTLIALDNTKVQLSRKISLNVKLNGSSEASEMADKLKELFMDKPGDSGVCLRLRRSRDFELFFDIDSQVTPDSEFRKRAEAICGSGSLEA